MKHWIAHKLTAKLLVIVALHASVTFDAWTTNRAASIPYPAGIHFQETDPLMMPFAGSPSLYTAINLLALPIDLAILRSKTKKTRLLSFALAAGMIAIEAGAGAHNLQLKSRIAAQYKGQFVCSGCQKSTK